MTNCANCSNTSAYVYEISPVHAIEYCDEHLPRFLTDRKNAGLLKRSDSLNESQAEAFEALTPKPDKKATSKKTTTPEEEPVSEEADSTPAE